MVPSRPRERLAFVTDALLAVTLLISAALAMAAPAMALTLAAPAVAQSLPSAADAAGPELTAQATTPAAKTPPPSSASATTKPEHTSSKSASASAAKTSTQTGAKATTKSTASGKSRPGAKTASGSKSASTAKTATAPTAASAKPAPAAPPAAPAGPHFSAWSEFRTLTPGQMLSLQVRVGAVGDAAANGSPAIFGSAAQPLDPDAFRAHRHAGQRYEPDGVMPYQFTASPEELAAVIDSLNDVTAVAEGRVSSAGQLSIAMMAKTEDGARAFEAVLAESDARAAMSRLLGALSANFPAVTTLREIGCRTGTLPIAAPESLDARVKLVFSGLRQDKASPSELYGTVTLTNISEEALPSPLTLIVLIDGGAKLIGSDGTTCRAEPAGKPFVTLDDAGSLAFKASVQRNVRLFTPDGVKPEVTFKLVGGPGTR
jgi:hypothetical protein